MQRLTHRLVLTMAPLAFIALQACATRVVTEGDGLVDVEVQSELKVRMGCAADPTQVELIAQLFVFATGDDAAQTEPLATCALNVTAAPGVFTANAVCPKVDLSEGRRFELRWTARHVPTNTRHRVLTLQGTTDPVSTEVGPRIALSITDSIDTRVDEPSLGTASDSDSCSNLEELCQGTLFEDSADAC